jgi:hypothetical protein
MLPVLSIVAIVGCAPSATRSVPVSDPWLGVAGLIWDQRDEEKEIHELFRTNEIESAASGSIHVGIAVHQSQVDLAMALLKTNHLVTSGKVVLLERK